MNSIQRAHYLRIRVALLLLVSIFNFVASPVSFATRGTGIEAAALNAPQEQADFIRQISLTTNDLVYSATTGKIYASRPSSVGVGGNSIAAIDPTTGLVTGSTFIGSEPNKLALADDGQNLYISLDGSSALRRFDVVTNTPGLQF